MRRSIMENQNNIRFISRFVLLVVLLAAVSTSVSQKADAFDTLALMKVIGFKENGNVLLLNSDNQMMPEVEPPKFRLEKGNTVIVDINVKYENGNLMIEKIRIDDILGKGKNKKKPDSSDSKGI
jgi:hypothetical protein